MATETVVARCSVFMLSTEPSLLWAPVCNHGVGEWINVFLRRADKDSTTFDLSMRQAEDADEYVSIIDICDDFQWIQIQPDFFEGYAPRTNRRVGIYCVDVEQGRCLNKAVRDAVTLLITEKSLAMPAPSKLRHVVKILYNEDKARYECLPASWAYLNCQLGIDYELLHRTAQEEFEAGIATPLVFWKNQLYKNKGLETEGIFRAAADATALQEVKSQILSGGCEGSSDPHIAANIIKIFFREMPVRLIDLYMSSCLADASNDASDVLTPIWGMREPYRSLLLWLLQLAVEVVEQEEMNRMNAKSIAVVFAPNLVSHHSDERAFSETQQAIAIMEALVRASINAKTVVTS